MAKKKIRWTVETLSTVDINKLSRIELIRAYNFGYHRANRNIENLIKYEKDTGYRAQVLDFIENPGKNKRSGEGIFEKLDTSKMTVNQLRRELSRVKYFFNQNSSNIEKTKEVIKEQKKNLIEQYEKIGVSIDPKTVNNDNLSKFYELFRQFEKHFKSRATQYDSDSLMMTMHEVVQKYGFNVNFNNILTQVQNTFDKYYKEKIDRHENNLKIIKDRANKAPSLGSSEFFSDLLI